MYTARAQPALTQPTPCFSPPFHPFPSPPPHPPTRPIQPLPSPFPPLTHPPTWVMGASMMSPPLRPSFLLVRTAANTSCVDSNKVGGEGGRQQQGGGWREWAGAKVSTKGHVTWAAAALTPCF
jgi:hypothetical protein